MRGGAVPVAIEIRGSPVAMGEALGEALRPMIQTLAQERLEMILEANPRVHPDDVKEVCNEVLSQTEALLPDIFLESYSTARSAGLSHWMLLLAGGFSDVIDCVSKRFGSDLNASECTIWSDNFDPNFPKIVGTWDSHASACSSLVLVRRVPIHGPATLALSTAGWPMQQGLTSSGLAFAIANMVSSRHSQGTSYICALPQIVACGNATDACKAIEGLPLCSARYFALSDSSGKAFGVETDGVDVWTQEGIAAHTNHFVDSRALSKEGRPWMVASSEQRRRSAIKNSLKSNGSSEFLFSALAFNDGTENSICQVGQGREDKTCAVFVIDPKNRTLSYSICSDDVGEPITVGFE